MLRVGIVAGEDSGDILGASLIEELSRRHSDIEFVGIAGPRMQSAGCKAIFPAERLAVMGIAEVARRFLELLAIRRHLVKHFLQNPPDVFIGVDAPDFNLGLERRLKSAGIPTVHFVSPSIWAWRGWRKNKIARSADMLLTLFPFEEEIYRSTPLKIRFVGHPLADQMALSPDRDGAREQLGLDRDTQVIALLPGSRKSEVRRLIKPFLETARWCATDRPELQFIIPAANPEARQLIDAAVSDYASVIDLRVVEGQAHQALAAANVVLLASGTAALEALLQKRPMLVAYLLGWGSYWLIRILAQVPFLSLPNQLTTEPLVYEFFQREVQPAVLGQHLLNLLNDESGVQNIESEFTRVHKSLRCDAGARAAEAILELLQ